MDEKKRLVWLYYAFQFTFSMLFWVPIFFQYQKAVGLSEAEIFQIQSLYYIAFCVLEIPTGYFADRFGYQNSMKAGAVLLIGSNLLAIAMPNYLGLLLHWLVLALSRSLISGASSAYLYEFLRQRDLAPEYQKIEGAARGYTLFGRVLCFAIVGFLMEWKLSLPYWLTVFSAVLSVYFAFRLPSLVAESATRRAAVRSSKKVSLSEGMRLLSRSPWLIFLMVQGVAVFVLGRFISVNLFQPILESKHIPLRMYGLVMGGVTVFEALGSLRPGWVRRFASDLNSVFLLSGLMGASLLFIPSGGAAVTLAVLCAFSLLCGFAFPIQKQLMNDAISDPRYRATLLSAESILDRAVCAGFAVVLEKLAFQASGHGSGSAPFNGFILIAGFSTVALMACLWVFVVQRKKGHP